MLHCQCSSLIRNLPVFKSLTLNTAAQIRGLQCSILKPSHHGFYAKGRVNLNLSNISRSYSSQSPGPGIPLFFTKSGTSQLAGRLLFSRINSVNSKDPWLRPYIRRFVNSQANGSKNNNGKPPSGTSKGGKALPKKSEIIRLLSLVKPEKAKLIGAVILLFISSAVTMAVPFSIGRVIDIIYAHNEDTDGNMVDRLQNFCLILLGIFVCGALANFGRIYIMSCSGNRIVKRLRELLFGSIIRQEMAFFDKTRTGELINRLSADTSLVGNSVTTNISDGLRSVAQAVAGVSMMFYVSPKLALISLSIVPPIALISRVYGRYVQRITKNVQDGLADATQVAEERLANMRTVRAFTQEPKEISIYNDKIEHVLQLSYKEALARGIFWASTGLSGNFMILTIFYTGGIMMNEATITVGELSSFLMYAAFVGVSIGGLSTFYTELMRGLGASTRLWQLVDRMPEIPLTDGLVPSGGITGTIELKDISFSYPSREDISVLKNLNLQVPQGSVLAVVGSSGSGKSTLASLLLRYYDPQGGSILMDGADIKDVSPYWLRSHMGVVSQEPILFSSSVADNIAYGALEPSEVSPQQIVEAAKMANAYNFIQAFPDKFDTLVGERGVMLSGGQKQRIAIARAILKNPEILLLDEATSALDAESEHLVQEALERIMVGRTVIMIAHRLSTIKNANKIAVLDKGSVAEIGSYNQLMAIPDGMFKKLVERQTISS